MLVEPAGRPLVREHGSVGDHESDRRDAEDDEQLVECHGLRLRRARLAPQCSAKPVQSQTRVNDIVPARGIGAFAIPKLNAVMGVTNPMTT